MGLVGHRRDADRTVRDHRTSPAGNRSRGTSGHRRLPSLRRARGGPGYLGGDRLRPLPVEPGPSFPLDATRTSWYWPFPAAMLLTLLPLVGARFLPMAMPGPQFGFLGISYVTFRSLDVIFGIRDRLIVSLPADQFLAFLFFFPAISSGPMDRYRRYVETGIVPVPPADFWKDLDGDVHRVFTGFLLSSSWRPRSRATGSTASPKADSSTPCCTCTGTVSICTSVSPATDLRRRGQLPAGNPHTENFNRPFLASNIKDFWNRSHSASPPGSAIVCT